MYCLFLEFKRRPLLILLEYNDSIVSWIFASSQWLKTKKPKYIIIIIIAKKNYSNITPENIAILDNILSSSQGQ